jgi:23S rRNA (adenine-N6)-dimethyltransferase
VAVRRQPRRGAPGQHFLRSSRLAEEIVRDAGVAPGELVVDVGAGAGVLTRPLLRAEARVLALELDAELARDLRSRFDGELVTVLEVDALEWPLPSERFAVLANLPFAGSGAFLARLLHDPGAPLRRADVIVQWELAAKQANVWPATLKGAYWRAFYELTITRRLSRSAFAPVPSVDAAVLRVTRRDTPLVSPADHERFWRFLSRAFHTQAPLSRALRTQLSSHELRRLAPVLGFSVDALPRDLDSRQWAGLFGHARRRRGRGSVQARETDGRRRAN